MPTKREKLEKLVHEMKSFADECDAKDEVTADDVTKLNAMGADVKALVETIKAEATASGNVDMAKAFLADLAGAPAPKASDGPPEMKDGIVNPSGMTLGEAFTKSPAYTEFIENYKGNDGRIREVSGIKTAAFDVEGFNRAEMGRHAPGAPVPSEGGCRGARRRGPHGPRTGPARPGRPARRST